MMLVTQWTLDRINGCRALYVRYYVTRKRLSEQIQPSSTSLGSSLVNCLLLEFGFPGLKGLKAEGNKTEGLHRHLLAPSSLDVFIYGIS